jgi:hypothetical protein
MALLRTLLILLLVFLGVRLLMRVVLPMLAALFFRRVEKKIREQQDRFEQDVASGFEEHGDVVIKRPSSKKKSKPEDDEGEFVDFKEVK